jgi:hypothetical protein
MINLHITSKGINNDIENELMNELNNIINFAIIKNNSDDYLKIIDIMNNINEKYNLTNNKLTINQIISIKNIYTHDLIIKKYKHLLKNIKNIYNDYMKKKDILYLSKKYNYPPVGLFRIILKYKNKNKKQIYDILNNPTQFLNDVNKMQLQIALNNDIFLNVSSEQNIYATNFELDIENNILKKNNIQYMTQNELSKEQIKLYGKPINTPDFVTFNLNINNVQINWIDAKNYYGANINFVYDKTLKQIEKYINTYGMGCIIYKYGFSSKLYFEKTLIFKYDDICKI